MTLESIDKLRGIVGSNADGTIRYSTVLMLLDEIEAEIADSYMKLPTDADGVPIRVGDELEFGENGNRGIVKAINEYMVITLHTDCDYTNYAKYGLLWDGRDCRHVKPDPLKELLDEFATDVANYKYDGVDFDTYAERIRELLGVK